jgi:hypothetical protein
MKKTTKDSDDMSLKEARIIQWLKITMMAFFLGYLMYKIGDRTLILNCY